ncbi:mucolipin-3-like isoform X3 [Mercenaria mercenaria]|uniref:mucolipin-3-like isoform X3 n=2 Tax=Mercenaria mercenaria TaxID=6596 RepID=UPI00234EABC0|nr:mucolipin-3-like isoform X3 [Mercenaria mercenaria]
MASVDRQEIGIDNISINSEDVIQKEEEKPPYDDDDKAKHNVEARCSSHVRMLGNIDEQSNRRGNVDSRSVKICSKHKNKGSLWLTFALRLFLFSPIKWKGGACWISVFHLAWFVVYIVKICYLTHVTFQIGHCRERVSSIIEDGYIALHHTLLQNWDASYETLPYPPSIGKFAVYNTDDLRKRINYAVENVYNAESEATGYFRKLPGDDITIYVVCFDLIDDPEKQTLKNIHTNVRRSFKPDLGLSKHEKEDGNTLYSYNVTVDLNNNNMSSVLDRALELRIAFSIHSLRVDRFNNDLRCLHIYGNVSFNDEDHNGQVNVNLFTDTLPIRCTKMNYSLTDSPQCRDYHGKVALGVEILAYVAICGDCVMFVGGIIALIITYAYMRKHYKSIYGEAGGRKNLPWCEYFGNVQWWHIPSITGDVFTLLGVRWIIDKLGDENDLENQPLNQWDKHVVYIGSGCLLTWFSLLRFIKINHKFTLLFKTIQRSAVDVIFFLACVIIIFVGFWSCAYIVLGPYHVKFQSLSTTAESLFAMINGDEIFASFALLQKAYVGDINRVWLFSRIIIYGYVTIFTVLAFNLLIALFNSAYEVVKNSYEQQKETRKDSIPTTLSYFMCMDFSTDRTPGICCKISYDDRNGLFNCRPHTISCCRNRDCACGLFSKLIQFMCFKIFTICCCQCETQASVPEDNECEA